MPYRQTAVLSDVDAAYLAGLIDGEGTIALTRLHRGQNRQLVVSISSTERAMLDWVLRARGGPGVRVMVPGWLQENTRISCGPALTDVAGRLR